MLLWEAGGKPCEVGVVQSTTEVLRMRQRAKPMGPCV